MISEAMAKRIETWPIERLIPYDRNPRTHSEEQVTKIAASIAEFGFVNPVLVDNDAGVIAGHGRLRAAQRLNLRHVPVIVLDHLTEAQRKAYLLADNRLAEMSGWDADLLRLELKDLESSDFNLDLIGFSDEEIEDLLGDAEESKTGLTDEDDAPEAPVLPVSRKGDVWVLGKHRLLCGDATDMDAVQGFLAGVTADLVFTDPPYNVDYEGYTGEKLTIQGDRMSQEAFDRFLKATFRVYRRVVNQSASLYVCHPSSAQREFQGALESAGFAVRCQIIWAKSTFAWGFGRYKFQHEPIFYCHVAGQSDDWYGDKSQSTLWQEKKPAANRLHPTMKPVELIERALVNSSRAGDCVLDLFGGSGSTLIAAERRGRRARLVELDPKYVDVIVRRWQDHTGELAALEDSEATFDEVASQRASEVCSR